MLLKLFLKHSLERKCVYQKPCDVYSNWSPELQGEMFTEDEYCMYKYGSQYTNANGIFCVSKTIFYPFVTFLYSNISLSENGCIFPECQRRLQVSGLWKGSCQLF